MRATSHHRRSRASLHVLCSAATAAAAAAALISHAHSAPTSIHAVLAFQSLGLSTSRTTAAAIAGAHPIQSSRSRSFSTSTATHPSTTTSLCGWLDNFLPKPYDADAEAEAEEEADAKRRQEYPEQYPATYELLPPSSLLPQDKDDPTGTLTAVRPLLKQTQLEGRPLRIAYDANVHGWDASSFHARVDGCGAAVVLATTTSKKTEKHRAMVGGYNPKGWAGLGGARPSVAAFLFYQGRSNQQSNHNEEEEDDDDDDDDMEDEYGWQKLAKVGGGGLACANDDPRGGIYFGPDGLVIPLRSGDTRTSRARAAQSKLGPYFERGPEDLASIFSGGAAVLEDLKVVVGVYEEGEDIPYSGGVMDMTSG